MLKQSHLLITSTLLFIVYLAYSHIFSPDIPRRCITGDLVLPDHNIYDYNRQEYIVDPTLWLENIKCIDFEWLKWLDLEKTRLHYTKQLDEKFVLLRNLKLDEDFSKIYHQRSTWEEQSTIAQLYCENDLTIPSNIIKVFNNGSVEQFEPLSSDKARLHRQCGHSKPTKYQQAHIEPLDDSISIAIDEEEFIFRVRDIINRENPRSNRRLSLVSGLASAPIAAKYFHEVKIKKDKSGVGVHYDWRFFRRVLDFYEHKETLHLLARNWQKFADSVGIKYWYAHGSVLGYMWNGMSLPWDRDHDIQMPVLELDRLASQFNRTIVITDENQHSKYLIDVNPSYVHRNKGNGKNVIDARFVDIHSGLYIDITGLAETKAGEDFIYCKNMHKYPIKSFLNLTRTQFEGYPAFMPGNIDESLKSEYRHYSSPIYKEWIYDFSSSKWIRENRSPVPQSLVHKMEEFDRIEQFIAENHNAIEYAYKYSDAVPLELIYNTSDAKLLPKEFAKPQLNWVCGKNTRLYDSIDLSLRSN